MTQIRSMDARPRRPGELGVHSVDHFNFVVPDLKQAQTFYADSAWTCARRATAWACTPSGTTTAGAGSARARPRS